MSAFDLLVIAAAIGWSVWAWKTLPERLAQVHEKFRNSGESPVFRESRISGQLVRSTVRLKASECVFSSSATFYLFFPCIRSKAVAGDLKVEAVTRWPTMKSYFVIEQRKPDAEGQAFHRRA